MAAHLEKLKNVNNKRPIYNYRGVTITVYTSGNRCSARFQVGSFKVQRVERSCESAAVDAAKVRIQELLAAADPLVALDASAAEILKPWKMTVTDGARLVDQQLSRLKPLGASLTDAVDFFIRNRVGKEITVEEMVADLLRIKNRDTGMHNTKDLRNRLKGKFCPEFGSKIISSITCADITKWLDELPLAPRSRRNHHSAVVTLFNHARERGYVPQDTPTAADRTTKPKHGTVVAKVLEPSVFCRLIRAGLNICSPALLPLLMQGQGGARTEELCHRDPKKDRLRWGDFDLDGPDPEFHVRTEVAKKNIERYSYIPKALAAWLRLFQLDDDEPIYPGTKIYSDYAAIAEAAEFTWIRNAIRKSFNTYHSALSGSLVDTGSESGTSQGIIRKYYRREIPRVRAKAMQWFTLGPDKFEFEVKAFLSWQEEQRK